MWDLQTIKRMNSGKRKPPLGLNCSIHLPKRDGFGRILPKKEEALKQEIKQKEKAA